MRPELYAEEGTLKGLVLSLEYGNDWVIGRDPEICQLILEDPAASRAHARIEKREDAFFIENLSETNPIELNDHPIYSLTPLNEGDKIKIGGSVFRFYPNGAPLAEIKEEEEEEARDVPYETIFKFEEEKPEEIHIDLSTPARFVLKVIAGPNSGAEFALEENKTYTLGTNTAVCDIIFHDLSVSRQHAKLEMRSNGEIYIEDLNSRNGVMVDRERIERRKELLSGQVVILGTSAFLIVDREAPVKTIVAPTFELPKERAKGEEIREREEELAEEAAEEAAEERIPEEAVVAEKARRAPLLPGGALIVTMILGAIAVLVGMGIVSLFISGKEVSPAKRDYASEITSALKKFTGVKYTYNPLTCKLFLFGHVSTGVEKNELLYNLRGLTFIRGVEDNIVNDECIWQEMNILLGKNTNWRGVSMHSPEPGVFVLSGYLQTNAQSASLMDYMNLNFPYLDRLKNLVVVDEEIKDEVESQLFSEGLSGVATAFANGELVLTGYISSSTSDKLHELVDKFRELPGVRSVKSFVVTLSPEKSVVPLHDKYPGRFRVTGYATHCNVIINVVINGKMYARGDIVEGGFKITSIQQNTIYLEKDGLKYKIEYNK